MTRLLCVLALLSFACGTDTIIAVHGASRTSPLETGGAASVPTADAPDVPPPSGQFHTEGSRIVDAGGNTVRIRAVSWYGFETPQVVVQGLWARSLDDILARVRELGFDTLRLPFSSELLAGGTNPDNYDKNLNPQLVGLNRFQTFTRVIERAGAHGLKVILVHHRSAAGDQKELWYTPEYPDRQFIADWRMLAGTYSQNAHVFAFELHCDLQDPATWGDGNEATDWRLAAERAGKEILSVNPDLIIIVNGVQRVAGAPYIWGGNLSAARDAPVRLPSGRLVYGAADYPLDAVQSNYGDPQNYAWLTDTNFPSNLPSVWNDRWGYLVTEGIAPVLLTSFGTRYGSATDRAWFDTLVPYMTGLELGFAYWTLNVESDGTGGLFEGDWYKVKTDRYEALARLLR